MTHALPSSPKSEQKTIKFTSKVDFQALTNEIPKPALVTDQEQGVILAGNDAFTLLSGTTKEEFHQAPIEKFIRDSNIAAILEGSNQVLQVVRHQGDSIKVSAKISALDPAERYVLIVFDVENVTSHLDQKQLIPSLIQMSQLGEAADIRQAMLRAVASAQDLLDTRLICIYQASSTKPELNKTATAEIIPIFPDVLPSSDLIKLTGVNIWQPGRRIQTDLHRVAKASNLQYLGTSSLGQDGAYFGLLVMGDNRKPPCFEMEEILTFFGAQIGNRLQHHFLSENLKLRDDDAQRQLAIYKSIIQNINEGTIFLDSELIVRGMNQTAETIFGYSENEIIGSPVENILIGSQNLPQVLNEALQGIPTYNMGSVSLHRRDGNGFPAHVQVIPVIENDSVIHILVIVSDISENEQIKLRTQQLEQRVVIGDLTAIFAHEVRNPINNISTGVQLLQNRFAPSDPNQDVLGGILVDCNRLVHLMDSILTYTRPTVSKMELMDLGEFTSRVVDRWRPRLAKEKIETYVKIEPGLPGIMGDSRSLEQVFSNILSNAIEAMRTTGGILAIKIGSEENVKGRPQIRMTITDNGPGMPEEIRDHVFEPFVTTKIHGTGLGLAITKQIMTAHKGSIQISSFPGGTVFHLLFPGVQGV